MKCISFSYASTDDYLMSGSFVVDNPPADRTGLGVWLGTLKLPAMKIVVPKTTDTADGTGKTSDESTLYLERDNPQSDTGMWKLVGGEASTGVSHSAALATAVPAAKSRPPMVDLGRVEMMDGSPSTFNLGGGEVCTITPTIGFDAVNSYDLVLLDGTEKISAPRQTAVVGKPVHISVGQTEVTFVPDVKSKR